MEESASHCPPLQGKSYAGNTVGLAKRRWLQALMRKQVGAGNKATTVTPVESPNPAAVRLTKDRRLEAHRSRKRAARSLRKVRNKENQSGDGSIKVQEIANVKIAIITACKPTWRGEARRRRQRGERGKARDTPTTAAHSGT